MENPRIAVEPAGTDAIVRTAASSLRGLLRLALLLARRLLAQPGSGLEPAEPLREVRAEERRAPGDPHLAGPIAAAA